MEAARFGDFVQIMLTERCNLRCAHCAVPEEESPAGAELDTAGWLRFLDVIADGGVRAVTVSGGEALLREDAHEVVEHALRLGIPQVTVLTNGLLRRRSQQGLISLQHRYPALGLHVSLDGASASTHDSIRGSGAFQATLRGLDRIRAQGGRVTGVHTVLHEDNIGEFDAIVDLVLSLRAAVWTVFPIAALGRATRMGARSLRAEGWAALTERLQEVRVRYGLDVGQMGPVIGDDWADDLAVQPRGRHDASRNVVVGPDGAMFLCPPLRGHPLGWAGPDLDAGGWQAAREEGDALTRALCYGCKFRLLCTALDGDRPWRVRGAAVVPAQAPGRLYARRGAAPAGPGRLADASLD